MVRRLRLASGLVLFAYITGHFINHSLGLVSIDAMEAMLHAMYKVWGSWPGFIALYAAFSIHIALALWSLYQRRSLRIPPVELAQVLLGFTVPLILVQHIIGTHLSQTLYGSESNYPSVLLVLWHTQPTIGVLQGLLLLVAWIHGCIGLNFTLKLKPWFAHWRPAASAIALLVPTLALLGYIEAGRTYAVLAQDPDWLADTMRNLRPPTTAQADHLWMIRDVTLAVFAIAIAAALGARTLRKLWLRHLGVVLVVTYPDGRRVDILRGASVLDASRSAGIPHASICGGRGRCSTCRVRVIGTSAGLPEPTSDELKVLRRVGAPPMVRLACQLRPTANISVTPLLPPGASARDSFEQPAYLRGSEREIAILFADLRSFTRLAETKLPYDVVFLLNRYFEEMGRAVEGAGGRIDKFIGDGVMALFGVESGPAQGCREALAGARAMAQRLAHLNESLSHDLEEPLRIGIGIHTGPAIIGEMGYGMAVSLTAVGDAVNTASRLETLTKTYLCELIVSQDLADRAEVNLTDFPRHEIEIRGRRAPLAIRTIEYARDLPDVPRNRPGPSAAAGAAAAD